MTKKTVLISLALLFTVFVFILFLSAHKSQPNIKSHDVMLNITTREPYDNFLADKINIRKKDDGKVIFSLIAERVVHRKRTSRFFYYQNLKEIYLKGVRIDTYPFNKKLIAEQDIISTAFSQITSSFSAFGKPSTPIEDYLSGISDAHLDLLSRVIIDDINIHIHYADKRKTSLHASFAKINADLETILLSGNVAINVTGFGELRTQEAIWSKKPGGIYLPNGYMLHGREHQGQSFFLVSENGLIKKTILPDIEYHDPIEEREKYLYATLSNKMPLHLKVILGMSDEYDKKN